MRPIISGILGVIAVAVAGYALVDLLPHIAAQYERLSASSRTLGSAYLVSVVVGGLVLTCAVGLLAFQPRARSRAGRGKRPPGGADVYKLADHEKPHVIEELLGDADQYVAGGHLPSEVQDELGDKIAAIHDKLDSGALHIVAFGTVNSGKSALLNTIAGREVFASAVVGGTTIRRAEVPWDSEDRVVLVDTPGLGEDRDIDHERIAREQAMDADLILFVLDGAMKDLEHRVLGELARVKKPMVICLNKADWYTDADRELLLGQIREYVAPFIKPDDVVAVRTRSASRTRIRVGRDGSEVEETVTLDPDIEPLRLRLQGALSGRQGLLLNNLLERAQRVLLEARERSRAHLDGAAWEVVNRYMWQAGAAAAISPMPILDIVAGLGFTTKMVLDLAAVYRQTVDLDAARTLIGELGKGALGILGANLATPTVGALTASLLKTVPGVGTLVGGAAQGFIQALLVRWIGTVFIEYFRKEMAGTDGLAELARRKWREVTQPSALADLARVANERRGQSNPEAS
jgi:small GTP-binding protein